MKKQLLRSDVKSCAMNRTEQKSSFCELLFSNHSVLCEFRKLLSGLSISSRVRSVPASFPLFFLPCVFLLVFSQSISGSASRLSARNEFVTSVAESCGKIYAAYEEGGVAVIENGKEVRLLDIPQLHEGVYSLLAAPDGNLWIGTNSSGIIVWNGSEYAGINYSNGLPGSHVYSLFAASDGSVWGGTENGAFQIMPDGTTSVFAPPFELPSTMKDKGKKRISSVREIVAITEGPNGEIVLGGASGGIILLSKVAGSMRACDISESCTGRTNSLFADSSGRVWICEDGALVSIKIAKGKILSEDYFVSADSNFVDRQMQKNAHKILPDHYVNSVIELEKDKFYVLCRNCEFILDISSPEARVSRGVPKLQELYAKCAVKTPNGTYLGMYGGGLVLLDDPEFKDRGQKISQKKQSKHIAPFNPFKQDLRAPKMPDAKDLKLVSGNLATAAFEKSRTFRSIPNSPVHRHFAEYLGEDWNTRGAWRGRYGNVLHILCAYHGCPDYRAGLWGVFTNKISELFNTPQNSSDTSQGKKASSLEKQNSNPIPVRAACFAWLGTKGIPENDALRHWLHWRSTDNPKTLESPLPQKMPRRQSEWDDHGEVYPLSLDGPGLFFDLAVPEGEFVLSMYFMNKDSHFGDWVDAGESRRFTSNKMNRFRDYLIEIKAFPDAGIIPLPSVEYRRISPDADKYRREREKNFDILPVLASARVHDFRAGVWKSFYLKGPAVYTVKLDRNHSYNTIICGVFLDRAAPEKEASVCGEITASTPLESCKVGGADKSAALRLFQKIQSKTRGKPLEFRRLNGKYAPAILANLANAANPSPQQDIEAFFATASLISMSGSAAELDSALRKFGAMLAKNFLSKPGNGKILSDNERAAISERFWIAISQIFSEHSLQPANLATLTGAIAENIPAQEIGYAVKTLTYMPWTNDSAIFLTKLLSALQVSHSELVSAANQLPPQNRYYLALAFHSAREERTAVQIASLDPAYAEKVPQYMRTNFERLAGKK